MADFNTELATLSDDVLDANAIGANTGLTLVRRVRGAYSPSTQVHAADTVDNYDLTRYIRSASRQSIVSSGKGFMRVEEFDFLVTTADLVAAGWTNDGTIPIGENWQVQIGTTFWPVVGVSRECGESMLKITVRTDMGQQV